MNQAYQNTLRPLRVRDKLLKNRIMLTKCVSGELQGAEHQPAEPNSSMHWLRKMSRCPVLRQSTAWDQPYLGYAV